MRKGTAVGFALRKWLVSSIFRLFFIFVEKAELQVRFARKRKIVKISKDNKNMVLR